MCCPIYVQVCSLVVHCLCVNSTRFPIRPVNLTTVCNRMGQAHVSHTMEFQTAGQDLLNQLLGCQGNLAFTPLAMKTILYHIAQKSQKSWRFTDQDLEDFSIDVGQSLRMMCRHFSQAMSKKNRPKWVDEILGVPPQPCVAGGEVGGEDEEGEEEEEEEEQAQQQEPVATLLKKPAAATATASSSKTSAGHTFFVGYDPQSQAAWRATSSTSLKECTKTFLVPEGAKAEDSMLACWPDGWQHEIAALTVGQFEALQLSQDGPEKTKGKGGGRPCKPAFATFGKYSVREKQDRSLLIYISDDSAGKRQICQLAADKLGNKHAALALMSDVCKATAEGKDPFEVRNSLVNEYLAKNPQPKKTRKPRKPKGEASEAYPEAPERAQAKKRPAAAESPCPAEGSPAKLRACKAAKGIRTAPQQSSEPAPPPQQSSEPAPATPPNLRRVVKSMMTLPEI
jgi:hypothetical protein